VIMNALMWLAFVTGLAACLAAIAARSLRSFSRRELEELCEARGKEARFADILHHHERVAMPVEIAAAAGFAISIGCASVRLAWQLSPPGNMPTGWAVFDTLVLVVFTYVIAAVLLPWTIARVAAASFLYRTWPLWNALGRVLSPLAMMARFFDALLTRVLGRKAMELDEESIEEEIRTIVSEGHREGLIEEDAREMIEGVIDLGDVVVSHIMTPRTEMHLVHVGSPWDELLEGIIESGHSRVPIYDKTKDDIVGILHIKDLLPELAKGANSARPPLTDFLRKPLFVPETKPVDELLELFQKSRMHIAVVLDEYGGVSGLVTIEDALEEIVGEIDDEYDVVSEEEIRKIDDDSCEALGRAHVDQINAQMGFDLPENEDFDTIGGFVFAEFGRVPSIGETLTWQDAVRVTVLEATRRRVNRVRLERVRQQSLEIA
jgi:CBS domain containing-hemolysin-like protein